MVLAHSLSKVTVKTSLGPWFDAKARLGPKGLFPSWLPPRPRVGGLGASLCRACHADVLQRPHNRAVGFPWVHLRKSGGSMTEDTTFSHPHLGGHGHCSFLRACVRACDVSQPCPLWEGTAQGVNTGRRGSRGPLEAGYRSLEACK